MGGGELRKRRQLKALGEKSRGSQSPSFIDLPPNDCAKPFSGSDRERECSPAPSRRLDWWPCLCLIQYVPSLPVLPGKEAKEYLLAIDSWWSAVCFDPSKTAFVGACATVAETPYEVVEQATSESAVALITTRNAFSFQKRVKIDSVDQGNKREKSTRRQEGWESVRSAWR